jgi:hypothetical protein
MIQPHIHNGQPGVIGEQHGLAKLKSTLEALTQGQTAQQQRDTKIQEQLATQAHQLATLHTFCKRLGLAIAELAVLGLALGGLVGWQITHRPDIAYARALGAVDATLVQQWGSLPKATQEALSTTYGRLGLVPPSHRKERASS